MTARSWLTFVSPASHPTINIIFGLLALLFVALLNVPGMYQNSMWYDESNVIEQSLTLNLREYYLQERDNSAYFAYPPLYPVTIKVWSTLAGDHDIVFRALSVWFGLMAAAFAYRIGIDFSGRMFGGFAAATILGSMAMFKYYANSSQAYTLYLMLALGLLFFFWRWWAHVDSWQYALGVVAFTVALQYIYYYGAFFILALNVYALILAIWRRRDYLRWLKLQLLAGLLILPWVPVVLKLASGDYNRVGDEGILAADSVSSNWDGVVKLMGALLFNSGMGFALLALVGFLAIWLYPRRLKQRSLKIVLMLALVLVASFAFALLTNMFLRSLTERRILFVIGLTAVLVGFLLAHLPRAPQWGLLLVYLLFTWDLEFPLPNNWLFRQGVEAIASQAEETDVVWFYFSGYLEEQPFHYYAERILPDDVFFAMQEDDVVLLDNHIWARDRLWVIWDDNAPPLLTEDMVKKGYEEIEQRPFGWYNISLYQSSQSGRESMPNAAEIEKIDLPQTFEGQFRLVDYAIDKVSAFPGEEITIWLDWEVVQQMDEDYGVYVHLLADDFVTLRGQIDGSPTHYGRTLGTHFWIPGTTIYDAYGFSIDPNTPPGSYTIKLGVYSYEQPHRLQVTPGDGTNSDGVVIARFEVE